MTNPAYEKLVEEVAKALMGNDRVYDRMKWQFAPDLTREMFRSDARAALAKTLETVTPEMVEAWEMAMPPEEFDLEGQSDAVINLAHAQSNWSAMLAASPLHERK